MDEIPLDLRLCAPFVLPLAFEETEDFPEVIESFSTITIINKNEYLL